MRIWLWSAVLLTACSETQPSPPEPVSDSAAELARVQCTRLFECCTPDEIQTVFTGATDADTCEPVVSNYLSTFVLSGFEDSANRGAVNVDPTKRDACLQALGMRSCESFSPNPNLNLLELEACRAWISPGLEPSEFCQDDFECRTGFCARDAAAADGVCKTAPELGEPCSFGRCGVSGFCDVDDLCGARVETGQPCTRNDECLSDNCVDGMAGRVCGERAKACQGQ